MNINTGQLKPENTKGKMADAFDVGSETTEDSTDCVFVCDGNECKFTVLYCVCIARWLAATVGPLVECLCLWYCKHVLSTDSRDELSNSVDR